jgi:hypothetical protein
MHEGIRFLIFIIAGVLAFVVIGTILGVLFG